MATDTIRHDGADSRQPLRGFGGMLSVELRQWFPWRVLTLIVAGAGIFASIYLPWKLTDSRQLGPLLLFGLGLWAFVMLIATIAVTEGSVLGDIHRGTASWLVTLPIARPAVIAAKFAASAVGMTAVVFVTGALFYPVLSSAEKLGITDFRVDELMEVTAAPIGQWGAWISLPTVGTYVAILASMSLLIVFQVSVMILLGTVLRSRTTVFGIGLVTFGTLLVGWLTARQALELSPIGLVGAIWDGLEVRSMNVAGPALATVLMSLAIVAAAMWRFQRRELR